MCLPTFNEPNAVYNSWVVLFLDQVSLADTPHFEARLTKEQLPTSVVEVQRPELIRTRRVWEETEPVGTGSDGLGVLDRGGADAVPNGVDVRRTVQQGAVLWHVIMNMYKWISQCSYQCNLNTLSGPTQWRQLVNTYELETL